MCDLGIAAILPILGVNQEQIEVFHHYQKHTESHKVRCVEDLQNVVDNPGSGSLATAVKLLDLKCGST